MRPTDRRVTNRPPPPTPDRTYKGTKEQTEGSIVQSDGPSTRTGKEKWNLKGLGPFSHGPWILTESIKTCQRPLHSR